MVRNAYFSDFDCIILCSLLNRFCIHFGTISGSKMLSKSIKNRSKKWWKIRCKIRSIFDRSWVDFGVILGSRWGQEASKRGPTGVQDGPKRVKKKERHPWFSRFSKFGRSRRGQGGFLRVSWGVFGGSWGVLGGFWGVLEGSWEALMRGFGVSWSQDGSQIRSDQVTSSQIRLDQVRSG